MSSGLFTTRPTEVPLRAAQFTPPLSRYVDEDDTLVVDTLSSTAPAPLVITAVVVSPEGQVQTLSWTHTPHTDRTRSTSYFPLSEGFLLSVIVDAMGLAYNRGQCWCTVGLTLGSGSAVVPHSQLIADYVTGLARLCWPGGIIRSSIEGPGRVTNIAVGNPAAGAEWSQAVPAGALWKLLAVYYILTTAAAVANRAPNLLIDDGANTLLTLEPPGFQTATLVRSYNYATGVALNAAIVAIAMCPFPVDLRLPAGYRVRSTTDNIQAADQYSAIRLTYEELLQP